MRPEISRKMRPFKVISDFSPAGDQPTAIAELTQRLLNKEKFMITCFLAEIIFLGVPSSQIELSFLSVPPDLQ